MRSPRRGRRGFTLLEMLLTMIVIAVGMMGVMQLFENAARGALQADLSGIATVLAREKLERIAVDKVRDGYAAIDAGDYPQEHFSGEFSPYVRTTEITEVSGDDLVTPEAGSGFKRVVVTVRWGAQPSERIAIATVFADY